jgi:membrane protein
LSQRLIYLTCRHVEKPEPLSAHVITFQLLPFDCETPDVIPTNKQNIDRRADKPPFWAFALAAIALVLGRPDGVDAPPVLAKRKDGHAVATYEDDGRGRRAATPSDIPAKGWKDIAWRVYHNIPKHRVIAIAAGVTFFVLLAIFPAIAAMVAIYGLFADPSTVGQHLNDLSSVLPGGATEVIGDQLNTLTSQPQSKLGFALVFGLAVSLWSANAGMKALFDALNVVYGEEEKRSFLKLNAVSLAFTLGALLFLVFALAAIAVLPVAMSYLGLSGAIELLIGIGKWPILLTGVAVAFALIYRYGPSRQKPQWRWVTWGSAGAAIAWLVMSILFSWYAGHFGSYNKTYGSLGAAIGFMTWIWLSAVVVLLGAEFDAEMEHQTAHDTTEGPPKPLGRRGAQVADTVGRASD